MRKSTRQLLTRCGGTGERSHTHGYEGRIGQPAVTICSWSENTALTQNTSPAATTPSPTDQSSGSMGQANTGS
jgi:hypothetical protein